MQLPVANGTLANIRQYSKCLFGDDEDQRQTFECLTASFVLKLYQRARAEETSLESTKKRFLNTEKSVLEKVNSEVCSNLGIKFDSKTIVDSAITGAAAVSIRGQTTASALCLKRHNRRRCETMGEYICSGCGRNFIFKKNQKSHEIPKNVTYATKQMWIEWLSMMEFSSII
ncbi:hypothetical protein IV203_033414 [Nitzschia inconspicua]|uniref:Uncharacterized protein n=1 Tax=Nitzschia inconspicua TaxID=303405 RepID=A0A9K3K5H6_9STRA|nr:hypothetical protein IV203_033414 [Nitzschia inconspicua]